MTDEARKALLSKYTEITEFKDETNSIDTELPIDIESSGDTIKSIPSDESNLTYDELIVEFNQFKKSAVMSPITFQRLWN
jgi:hypothetical protein